MRVGPPSLAQAFVPGTIHSHVLFCFSCDRTEIFGDAEKVIYRPGDISSRLGLRVRGKFLLQEADPRT